MNDVAEHDLQNAIRLKLSELGYCTFRMNVGKFKLADGRFFDTGLPKGTSDLLIIKNGKAIWLEVKTPTGRVRPEQIKFIEQMKKHGCSAGIVRSVEDAVKICEEA